MKYTVNQLAKLAHISPRTLRYYHQLGLLIPKRLDDNNYRIYGEEEVDRLQQILFYRELGIPLEKIGQILAAPDYDIGLALLHHLDALRNKKLQLETLISNVEKTIATQKGEDTMTDTEKFEGFKQQYIADNEATYGQEVRDRFGDTAMEGANQKISAMSQKQWQETQELSEKINQTLAQAFEEKDPGGATAQEACELHRQWLCRFWKEGTYSKAAHKALAQGYVDDPRFTAYYDKIAPGCTVFLRDALAIYCAERE